MKLENTLTIPVPADEAWRVLLDIERIAPCVPGATLTSRDDDGYHGKMKVKLGAIGLTYNGTVKFLSRDEDAKIAVLEAGGREARGNGTAKALVTCRLVGTGDTTDVFVETELGITGKPAQFGRGALAEVSGALVDRFAANLAEELTKLAPHAEAPDEPASPLPPVEAVTAESSPAALPTNGVTSPAARHAAEPIDLLDVARAGTLKRFAPYAAGIAAGLLLGLAVGGRRRSRTVEVTLVDCRGHLAAGSDAVVHSR